MDTIFEIHILRARAQNLIDKGWDGYRFQYSDHIDTLVDCRLRLLTIMRMLGIDPSIPNQTLRSVESIGYEGLVLDDVGYAMDCRLFLRDVEGIDQTDDPLDLRAAVLNAVYHFNKVVRTLNIAVKSYESSGISAQ